MSIPETGPTPAAQYPQTAAAEQADTAASPQPDSPDTASPGAVSPEKADPWNDARLPWSGKPRAADILCWLGIVLSGLFYWLLLPLRVSLLGTHPVIDELLNGSVEAIISAAAFARAGHGSLVVVVLAAIPGLMKFDPLYWWAGRLWGERFIMTLPGSQRIGRFMDRVRRAGRKATWPAVLVSSFLPLPRAVIYVIAGWAGMRLVTFLVLDLIGSVLWIGMLTGLGYTLGHSAVVVAKTVSHYGWWFTIGLLVLTVVLTLRSQRRLAAATRPLSGSDGFIR